MVFGTVTPLGGQGFVVALPADARFVFIEPLAVVAEVAEPGVALVVFVADVADPGVGVVIAGQGAALFGIVVVVELVDVPVVEVAPAGTFEFGFVVEVADAGVLPGFVVFCCVEVAGVVVDGVVVCVVPEG